MVTNTKEYFKAYYDINKEHLKAYQRSYYHRNKKVLRDKYSAYSKEYGKKYYYDNKERIIQYRKAYYLENKKRIIARQKEIINAKRHGIPIVRNSKYMHENEVVYLKPSNQEKKDVSPSNFIK